MSGTLTVRAYRRMLVENIAWLRQQPNTLERRHTELVLIAEIFAGSDGVGYRKQGSRHERARIEDEVEAATRELQRDPDPDPQPDGPDPDE